MNAKTDLKLPIYMDYAATTPVDPRVADKMIGYLSADGVFGNPASRSHSFGWQAEEAVEHARADVAALIGADSREIVWTSGATEADNLAIKGAAHFYAAERGRHVVSSAIEHKAVLESCRQLEKEGFEVTLLEPDDKGVIAPQKVAAALRDDTVLVSLMHVNNEIGVLNDIGAIGAVVREHEALFHVDAAQSVGKIPIDVEAMNIDLMSLSGHKLYGPKGVGALYARRKPRVRLEAAIHGGGHERGMRAGTLPTHQIVGMGEACRICAEEMETERRRIIALRERFLSQVMDMEEMFLNGHPEQTLPGIVNISVNYVEGESLIMSLPDVAISSGSACTSASLEPSYVLRALGLNDELAHSSLRFGIGRFTTEAELDYVADKLREAVGRLRELSPLWDMYKDGVDLEAVQWAAH